MAESRDTGHICEGPDDKEAKRRKLPDPKQAEEEKPISPKGNESSSISPKGTEEIERKQEVEKTEGSSSAQGFDSDFEQMIDKLFAGENIARPVLPLKKREIQFLQGNDSQNLVFSLAESGDSEDSSSTDDSGPVGMLLFEIQLKPSNMLVIPAAKASQYFPAPTLFSSGDSMTLRITDLRNQEWAMSTVYYTAEEAFLFLSGWTEFANWHKLDSSDVIGFYRPMPRWGINHFLVKFERTVQSLPEIPDFSRENFLFQIELGAGDIGFRRLFMPSAEVEIHFPAIRHIEGENRRKEMIRFTDAKGKDWYMEVVYYSANSYMIIKEWHEFVGEHELEAKDVIKFYKPVEALHLKHFLVEIVRKEVGANPSRSCGGGEPSGSGSYKGKEKIAAG